MICMGRAKTNFYYVQHCEGKGCKGFKSAPRGNQKENRKHSKSYFNSRRNGCASVLSTNSSRLITPGSLKIR